MRAVLFQHASCAGCPRTRRAAGLLNVVFSGSACHCGGLSTATALVALSHLERWRMAPLRAAVRDESLPNFTKDEVAQHTTRKDRIWVTFRDGVYDITDFVVMHPGGAKHNARCWRRCGPVLEYIPASRKGHCCIHRGNPARNAHRKLCALSRRRQRRREHR